MGTAKPLIGFMCTSAAHLGKNGTQVDHISVHERAWAYCPSDVRGDGHEWKETGGIPLVEVESRVRSMRERSLVT
jgi:hypothetical protein